jgi:hypothetical protein
LDPLIKSQLLYQLSYTPVSAAGACATSGEGAEHTRSLSESKGWAGGIFMARRDLTGAVDFQYLEGFTAGDGDVIDEVLSLFREQAAIWSNLLDPAAEGWRDAVHTIKGAARGIGAFQLGEACARAEAEGEGGIEGVRDALDLALADIAAYVHERALQSLRAPRS